jgi:prephenate dehydratase
MDPKDYAVTKNLFPDAEILDYRNYAKTYEAVEKGECDYAVMPFEASLSGENGHVLDLMFKGNLYICGTDKTMNGNEKYRYAVLTRENPAAVKEDGLFMLMFTVADKTGSLAKAINAISSNGFNIRFLHTRPLNYEEWGYYFYTECDGDDQSAEGQKMLSDLNAVCETLKFVGRYPSK